MCCSSSSSCPVFFPFLASSRNVKQTDWSHCFPVFPLIFMSVFYRTPLDLGSPRYKPASADNATDGNPAGLSNKQDAEPRGENVAENPPDTGRSETSDHVSQCDFSICRGLFFSNPSQPPSFLTIACFSFATRLT